jgi:hypothetical protein
MENLTTGGSSGVIFSVFGHAVLTPQAHFAFSSFKSGMGMFIARIKALTME